MPLSTSWRTRQRMCGCATWSFYRSGFDSVRAAPTQKANRSDGLVKKAGATQLHMELMNGVRNSARLCQRLQRSPHVAVALSLFVGGNLDEVALDPYPPGPVSFQSVVVGRKGFLDRETRWFEGLGK